MRYAFLVAMLSAIAAEPVGAQGFAAREKEALAQPFVGVTDDGAPEKGLFAIISTGVSTAPVVEAANAFLVGLTEAQRKATTFPVDDVEWRKWANVHRYPRQGVGFSEMDGKQRALAIGLLRASLSAKGLKLSQDIMNLNGTLGEMTGKYDEYTELLYWITVMGAPSQTEPWGWQIDGHHLVINYFVLGDQVVMTPTFMGSEPTVAGSGKFAGTRILDAEQDLGLRLVNALDAKQKAAAVVAAEKTANQNKGELFQDNVVVPYAGVSAKTFTPEQKTMLMALIGAYVGNMDDGHAKVKLVEALSKIDETYFAWMGGTAPDSVFYYRVHSPVILIEFDHQLPVALPGPRLPNKQHIHTVVRTPNGNDYGKDLLRLHYEQHKNDPNHKHQ